VNVHTQALWVAARLPAAITRGSRRAGVGVRRERRGASSFRAALPRWNRYGLALSPTCPAWAPTEAMMHDPRRYGVAARTGPGVLWWVRRPMCGVPVSVRRPCYPKLQNAVVACVGNLDLSCGNVRSLRACKPCMVLISRPPLTLSGTAVTPYETVR
jgi:hypothetical protein